MHRLLALLVLAVAAGSAGCATTLEDRDYEAIYFVEPVYPSAELKAGICGQVLLLYDLSKSGKVINVRARASTSKSFVASAIGAARQFKYKPRIEDGQRVGVRDIRRLVTFAIDGVNCEGGKRT